MARAKGKALERQRQERAEQREAARRSGARRRGLAIAALLVLAVIGLALFLMTRPPPPGLAETETFPDQGRAHLPPGAPAPAYNSEPPTSGPHAPQWAPCGIYRQPVPDVLQVHTLEHGAVIIQYDPSLPEEDVVELERLARRLGEWTLVAPRPGMPAPIALTAWTKRLLLDEVDPAPIRVFHQRFAGQGPERVGCPFEVDEAEGSGG